VPAEALSPSRKICGIICYNLCWTEMKERRQHKRYIKHCEIEFTAENITYKGMSGDFSLNGLFISTDSLFPTDAILEIVIHLPDGVTSKIKGKVRTVSRTSNGKVTETHTESEVNGMGVEIIEKDINYIHFISSLIVGIE
jgi:hypothetical protein